MDMKTLNLVISDESRKGVTYLGRVSTAKGAEILKLLADAITEPLHIIGDGPDLPSLRDYCLTKGYAHVKFWGKLSQKECFKILGSSLCSVVPSQCGEAFSLSAAESMALGTPVVGSDVGGLGSLLRRSGGGILVPTNDHNIFIDSVRRLLCNPVEAKAFGTSGRRFVRKNLEAELNANELIGIYEDVLRCRKKLYAHYV
jgi:glycosyltransferase involved in cell wall biosynthesis